MNSTIGQALVLGALLFAAIGGVVGLVGGLSRREAFYAWPRRAVYGFFACMLLANLTMIRALVTHDFSVKYVAHVGSLATPMVYTVVSLWSALEGSILFWGVILGTYLLAFTLAHRRENTRGMSLALGTMLSVGIFFAFLIAGPANPFTAVPNPLADGPGPNALLQNHILMVIHPPMLYLGYVGMVVPFGIALSSLMRGEMGEAWSVPLRRWTMIPWTFLSIGIILGSWWAYAVLGWGGYWAWDPVENASFLPWTTATAFLHSLMVVERKKTLMLWTVSLSLASFVLTIVGTFMTRSGIFNSVHSFTQSDIGPTFLVFIAIVLIVSIVLLTARGHLLLAEPGSPQFPPVSRETSILVNNLVLTGITFTVLVGTTFPLINEAIRGTRLSVGEPYFNKMAVPLGMAVLFLMGVGPSLPWGETEPSALVKKFVLPSVAGAAVVALCLLAGLRDVRALITYGLAGFAGWVTLRELFLPAWQRMREQKEALPIAVFTSAVRARRRFGGYIVHAGIITILVAIAASSTQKTHTTGRLNSGEELVLGNYRLKFDHSEQGREPHRTYTAAVAEVTNGSNHWTIKPRMNFYERQTDPVLTPEVISRPGEDFYVSLIAFEDEGKIVSFNLWTFPLVGWIWWSIPTLFFGSLIAMWPQRRRNVAVMAPVAATATADGKQGAA